MRGLTKAQRTMLELAVGCAGWFSLSGGREFQTARGLERKGWARVNMMDQLRITSAGRAALQSQETKS